MLPTKRALSTSSLTSSTSDVFLSSSTTTGEDVSTRIVRRLIAATRWSVSSFANRLRVPETCLEMCLATGASSQLLRASLRAWVTRGQDLPAALHHSDVVALKRDADARETPHGGSAFDELDDATRQHFEYLQGSIGQNFVSILNDPDARSAASSAGASSSSSWGGEWTSWLGQAVGAVAVGAGAAAAPTGNPGGTGPSGSDFSSLVSAAVAQATAAAASAEFNQYFEDMASVYRAHRELAAAPPVRLLIPQDGAEHGAAREGGVEDEAADERPAFPDIVSLEFASTSYTEAYVLAAVLGRDGFPQAPNASSSATANAASATATATTAGFGPVLNATAMLVQNLEQQHNAVASTLMSAVHARTPRFFHASQRFNDLVKETRAALTAAEATRSDVQDGGAALIRCFLRVARQARRREHCLALLAEAERLRDAANGLDEIDAAIGQRRFAAAVRSIRSVEATLQSLKHSRFAALDTASHRIADRRRALVSILRDYVTDAVALHKWDEIEWEGLGDALHAAHLLGCFEETIAAYRTEAALGAIDTIAASLISSRVLAAPHSWTATRNAALANAIAHGDVQASLHSEAVLNEAIQTTRSYVAQAVHLMKPAQFHTALVTALRRLEEHLMLCIRHKDVVADSIAAAANDAREATVDHAQWGRAFVLAVSSALQERAAWFFDARDDESVVAFSPPQLDKFISETLQQVRNMEQIAADQFVALDGCIGSEDAPGLWTRMRAAIGSQVRIFFKRHHDRSFERLVMVLGAEKWDGQNVIEPCFSRFTETLASSSDLCIRATLLSALNVHGKPDDVAKVPEAAPRGTDELDAAEESTVLETLASTAFPGAVVDPDRSDAPLSALTISGCEEQFVATNSLLILLRTLAEYDWCFRRFPLLAHDSVQRIKDALKLFDTQCAALVLGGSAVDHGTLAVISPQHLAIASQSLHFVATLAPKLQRRLARLAPGKIQAAVKELERIAKEAASHRNEAFQLLVDLFRQHLKPLIIDPRQWAMRPTGGQSDSAGHAWIVALLKECMRFWTRGPKPLLANSPLSVRCVVSGLVNVLSGRVREVALQIKSESDIAVLRNDICLFKTNIEGVLGTGVLHCAAMATTALAASAASLKPPEAESDVAVLEHLGCGASLGV